MKRYFLLILLSIFLFPLAVYADDYVAVKGGVQYTSLQEAIDSVTTEYVSIADQKNKQADTSQTITLLTSASGVTIPSNKAVVIDLNNFSLKNVTNNGGLSVYNGKIKLSESTDFGINSSQTAFTLIDEVTFTSSATTTILTNNGYLYIKGNSKYSDITTDAKLLLNNSTGEVTIYQSQLLSNGAIVNLGSMKIGESQLSCSDYYNEGIIINEGSLVIRSGEYTCSLTNSSAPSMFINTNSGTIQIDNGTFQSKHIASNESASADDNNKIIVNGGTFTSFREAFINFEEFDENSKNSIIINGGTINSETTDYILRSQSGTNTTNGTNDSISILGGTINANNSKGIYTCNNKLVVGNKNEINLEKPVINIKGGNIINCDNSTTELEFYGGIINSKNSLYDQDVNKLSKLVPLTNYVILSNEEDGYYENYLIEAEGTIYLPDIEINLTIGEDSTKETQCKVDKENGKYYNSKGEEITKEEYENQCQESANTGTFLPIGVICGGIILFTCSCLIVKKNTLLRKI